MVFLGFSFFEKNFREEFLPKIFPKYFFLKNSCGLEGLAPS